MVFTLYQLTRATPDVSKMVNMVPIHVQTKRDRERAREKRFMAATNVRIIYIIVVY
jgi:hypothetical protein